mgnify:CR=1 FL=1
MKLASQPKVDIETYEENKDLEASLACEVMPLITVPDLAQLKIEKPRIESDSNEINDALSRIADENRSTVALAKPRPAKVGDVVTIDFIGRIDGEAFEGGAAEGHALELGSNSFIPGFEDGLVGAKTDEIRNVPVTFLPWSFFAIIGTIQNISQSKDNKYILTFFPLILILTLSIFSTKTPYYTLQISSIFSLNAYVGVKYLFNSKIYNQIFLFITSKIIPLFIFSLTFTYYFFFKNTINFNSKENTFLILGLLFFGISWSFLKQKNSFKELLIILIIGPYLLTSFLLQSGLFTDRSRELREKMEYVSSLEVVKNQPIKVDKSGIKNSLSQSKIIRIALLTPKLGEGLESIDELEKSELVWTTDLQKINNNDFSFEVIYENDTLKPWKLILKN